MNYKWISDTALFRGMNEEEIHHALEELMVEEKQYGKGDVLLRAGSCTRQMGLVLEGSVTIESNDVWGNRTILSHVPAGETFAESYALLPGEPMMVDVTANESSRVLFIRTDRLILFPSVRSSWTEKMLMNMLMISAHKNLHMASRSFHTSPKTIRGRLLSFLNSVALRTGRKEFDIPFDRQQLADYLNLDRSALSKELGQMQREGYFVCRKSHFKLLRQEN